MSETIESGTESKPSADKTGRTGAKAKRAEAKAGRTEGEARAKAEVSVHEVVYFVSRVAAGFESVLKSKPSALSLSQWAMLEMLAQEEGGSARPSQIARKLGLSRQLIRAAAKKTMKLELISAEAPEEGKKAVSLTLTDAGRAALAEIVKDTDAVATSLQAKKRGGSLNQAARSLKLLSAAFAARSPNGSGKGKKKGEEAEDAALDETIAE